MALGKSNYEGKFISLENYLPKAKIKSKLEQKKAEVGASADLKSRNRTRTRNQIRTPYDGDVVPTILAESGNIYNHKDDAMSSTPRFLKFIVSDTSKWLRANYPNAFLLLCLIAERARREPNKPDGLWVGDVILARDEASKACGITVDQFRTALSKLEENNIVKIIKTHKKPIKRQNFPIKIPIKGMLINLCDSSIWDINAKDDPHTNPHAIPIESPCNPHKQERKERKEYSSKSLNRDLSETNDMGDTPKPPRSSPLKKLKRKEKYKFSEDQISWMKQFWSALKAKGITVEETSYPRGVEKEDVQKWVKKYTKEKITLDEICETVKLVKNENVKSSYPAYIQSLMNDRVVIKQKKAELGRKMVSEFIKSHSLKGVVMKKDYFLDNRPTPEQIPYSLEIRTLQNILEDCLRRSEDERI